MDDMLSDQTQRKRKKRGEKDNILPLHLQYTSPNNKEHTYPKHTHPLHDHPDLRPARHAELEQPPRADRRPPAFPAPAGVAVEPRVLPRPQVRGAEGRGLVVDVVAAALLVWWWRRGPKGEGAAVLLFHVYIFWLVCVQWEMVVACRSIPVRSPYTSPPGACGDSGIFPPPLSPAPPAPSPPRR